MAELLLLAILGHLIGDYLFQPLNMALGKSLKGFQGVIICTTHVLIYTLAVCLMMQVWDPVVMISIFVPHWIIDRWSLGEAWLGLIRGRTYKEATENTPGVPREVAIAFYAPVYIAVDNTLHILCLLATIKFLII